MATDAKKTDHAQEQNITLPMDTSTLYLPWLRMKIVGPSRGRVPRFKS